MTLIILYAITVAYALQAGILLVTGDKPSALVMISYCTANCGLIWGMQR